MYRDIKRERERERERGRGREGWKEKERDIEGGNNIYIYIYIERERERKRVCGHRVQERCQVLERRVEQVTEDGIATHQPVEALEVLVHQLGQ